MQVTQYSMHAWCMVLVLANGMQDTIVLCRTVYSVNNIMLILWVRYDAMHQHFLSCSNCFCRRLRGFVSVFVQYKYKYIWFVRSKYMTKTVSNIYIIYTKHYIVSLSSALSDIHRRPLKLIAPYYTSDKGWDWGWD